jgi:hypothetical protein
LDESPQESAATATDVRFSTRALLLVMVGVAIGAALLGPYFRGLAPEHRGTIAALWGLCGAMVLALVVFRAWMRFRIERQAGATVMAFTAHGRRINNARPWMVILGGCLWIAWGLFLLVSSGDDVTSGPAAKSPVATYLFHSGFSAMFIALGIATIWWNRRTQLREHGVVRGLKFLPWDHVTAFRWEDGVLVIEGVDKRHEDARLMVNVPAAQQKAATGFVSTKVAKRKLDGAAALAGGANDMDSPGARPAFVVTPREEVTMRRATYWVVCYMAIVFLAAFHPFGRAPFEFYGAALCGLIAMSLYSVYCWHQAGESGAPLVRLKARIDWLRIVGALLVVFGCYCLVQWLPWSMDSLMYAAGFVAGAALFTVFTQLTRENVDLCENGIVISRWVSWPWNQVTLARWNAPAGGRVVLRSGFRRAIAKVSNGQAADVAAVLREKLGAEIAG